MKKLFALMMVAGFAVAIVACGGKTTEPAAEAVDSSAQVVDSAAAPADSTAADSTTAATPAQ